MTDDQIIALFWARDEEAIRQTDAAYGRKLQGLAEKLLGSPQDAEECVSDAYMKAWETIPPQRPCYFFAYLAKLCRNSALDRLELQSALKRKGETVALTRELELCVPDLRHQRRLEGEELGRALNRFLEGLP